MGARTAICDFESRSACPIRTHGSWRYSLDPTTEVLCMAFRLPTWRSGDVALWHPAFPHLDLPESADRLDDLLLWIIDGGLVEAHNAFFERGIWANIMGPRYGWPAILPEQWRDSAAKAAAHALPRSLDDAADALGLTITKDVIGAKAMKKMVKPRKPRKKERETWAEEHGDAPMPLLWWESPELFATLFEYCKQDIRAEEALSHAVPDLSVAEQEVYCVDQITNERGFRLDRSAVAAAESLLAAEQSRLNSEIAVITNGAVTKATQRAKLSAWCAANGKALENTTAETIDAYLEWPQLPEPIRQALTVLRALGRSSTAKYEAMARWICPDGRAHGGLLYHAASTGRWGGQGIQPQNFPKGSLDHWDMDDAWEILLTGDLEFVRVVFGDVMAALAQALRGAIIPSSGRALYVADYAAIEARVLLWLAEDEDALDIFRRNEDIYCDFATSVYGRPITKADAEERGMGKIGVLGLGYQMGVDRFMDTCASFGVTIDREFAVTVVDAYRSKYRRVPELWRDQEFRAMQAVWNPGMEIGAGRVTWVKQDRYLYCVLPSGRKLAYPDPEVRKTTTSWGARREQLTFMGVSSTTHQWGRQPTYGGMLTENITQAVARDLMAAALVRCHKSAQFAPVLSVHDELVAEGVPGLPVRDFETLVATSPAWARGLPVKAEGWSGVRYRK